MKDFKGNRKQNEDSLTFRKDSAFNEKDYLDEILVYLEDSSLLNEQETWVMLMDSFNDTLSVTINSTFLGKKIFKTNESTGSAKPYIHLILDNKNPDTLIFDNSSYSFKLPIENSPNYVYVWRFNNKWKYSYREEPLLLE